MCWRWGRQLPVLSVLSYWGILSLCFSTPEIALDGIFVLDTMGRKSLKSSPQTPETHSGCGESSMWMELAPGGGASLGTRRALRLTCAGKRDASECSNLQPESTLNTSLLYALFRSLSPVPRRLVKRLAIKSDVIVENFKPGSQSSHLPSLPRVFISSHHLTRHTPLRTPQR